MVAKKTKGFLPVLFAAILSLTIFVFLQQRFFKGALPCANSLSCKESLQLSVRNGEKAIFGNQEIVPPEIDLAQIPQEANVLGAETATGEKHIYIDLTKQTLKAYQGDSLFMETKISSGKWFASPTGDFTIWAKFRATLMSGGVGADYYYLPNVPYVMYFYNSDVPQGKGFALHGAYWHNNFGHAMSHGCINMRIIDAQEIFYWSDPPTDQKSSIIAKKGEGTKITIYGEAP